MMMTNRTMKTIAVFSAGLLALTACSRSEPDAAADENAASEASMPVTDDAPTPAPSSPPMAEDLPEVANSAAIDVPPEPKVAPDAQMLDDAEATGMTARVSRGDEAPATNDQAPQ